MDVNANHKRFKLILYLGFAFIILSIINLFLKYSFIVSAKENNIVWSSYLLFIALINDEIKHGLAILLFYFPCVILFTIGGIKCSIKLRKDEHIPSSTKTFFKLSGIFGFISGVISLLVCSFNSAFLVVHNGDTKLSVFKSDTHLIILFAIELLLLGIVSVILGRKNFFKTIQNT